MERYEKICPKLKTGRVLKTSAFLTAGLICFGAAAHAETVTLELRNGDKLHGELIEADTNDSTIVLDHPVLGRLSIPRTALVPPPQHKPWKLSLSGGLSGSNTDDDFDSGATGQLKVSYTEGADEVVLQGRAEYDVSRDKGESKASTDTNEGDAELRYTRSLGNRLNAYAATRFSYDTLNKIGTDTILGSIGLGYDLFQNDSTRVRVSLGPSVQSTWGGTGCAADPVCGQAYAAGSARAELQWNPNSALRLNVTNTYTGAFADGIKTNNVFSVGLKIFPMGNERLFTSLNGQLIYNELQTPRINNSVSMQVGVQLD